MLRRNHRKRTRIISSICCRVFNLAEWTISVAPLIQTTIPNIVQRRATRMTSMEIFICFVIDNVPFVIILPYYIVSIILCKRTRYLIYREGDELLELIAGIQGKRMDEQRATLPYLPGLNCNQDTDDSFMEMLVRCQVRIRELLYEKFGKESYSKQ